MKELFPILKFANIRFSQSNLVGSCVKFDLNVYLTFTNWLEKHPSILNFFKVTKIIEAIENLFLLKHLTLKLSFLLFPFSSLFFIS